MFDPEKAHRLSINGLKLLERSPMLRDNLNYPKSLQTECAGLEFTTPIGLAPGYDKDAEVFNAILRLGFGFTEVGTLTPKAQVGNPKPRLFRLVEDQAVINRMGFNNDGQIGAIMRLKKMQTIRSSGILGINIGANKDSKDRIDDYYQGVHNMAPYADYLTVNISSPNTPGLRDLQGRAALTELLSAVMKAKQEFLDQSTSHKTIPVFLKVAPDLHNGDIDDIVTVSMEQNIDAIIISNTTISRPEMLSKYAHEAGGLSGTPLKELALESLRKFRSASDGKIPLIGVGGIATAHDAYERIKAGASLVQLYSSMVYHGPMIGRNIAYGLVDLLEQDGLSSIKDAVGMDA